MLDGWSGVRLAACIVAASRASWRQCVVMVACVTMPFTLLVALFVLIGIDDGLVVPIAYVAICFPLSFWLHEFAHAVAYSALFNLEDRPFEVIGLGTFRKSEIVRWALSADREAAIGVAGPAAGLLMAIPILWLSPNLLIAWPWMIPFLVHAFSLSPRGEDGKQLFEYLFNERPSRARSR